LESPEENISVFFEEVSAFDLFAFEGDLARLGDADLVLAGEGDVREVFAFAGEDDLLPRGISASVFQS
jgi:hypothetical protein